MAFMDEEEAIRAGAGEFETLGEEAGSQAETPYVTPLIVAVIHHRERQGRTLAALVHPFGYRHDKLDEPIVVPAYFETDFTSVPGALQIFIKPFGRHAKAAVLHDWLYADGEPGQRYNADRIFNMALKELGVDPLRRLAIFFSVRLFAGQAYGRPDLWTFANPRTGKPVKPPRPSKAMLAGH